MTATAAFPLKNNCSLEDGVPGVCGQRCTESWWLSARFVGSVAAKDIAAVYCGLTTSLQKPLKKEKQPVTDVPDC